MMSPIMSFFLVFLAYLPLWILICIREVGCILSGKCGESTLAWSVLGVLLGVGLVGGVWVAIRTYSLANRSFNVSESNYFRVIHCKEQKILTTQFVVKNTLPLLVFNPTEMEGVALTAAYFIIIASLSVKHRYFPENIFLEWIGWTFYECTVCSMGKDAIPTKTVTVISDRTILGVNQVLWFGRINNETYINLGEASDNTKCPAAAG